MKKLHLPYIVMPEEFISLLKANLPSVTTSGPIFDVIRPNVALYSILEKAFKEFDDGRGLEKLMVALGWTNFRERMASIYVYKKIQGRFPTKTNMELVEDIRKLESTYADYSVHTYSRIFLLGFYLKMASLEMQNQENNPFLELKLPPEINSVLKISQGRSEKIDWLILVTMHFLEALGDKLLINSLLSGKKFNDLYALMVREDREKMHQNLLAYGASIHEHEIFLYGKI